MSSKSEESNESEVKVEIQKTLFSINETAHKIKNELNIINGLITTDGHLHAAVSDANKTLITVAQNMNLNIEKILEDKEENNEDIFNLRNVSSLAAFQEKILKCLKDT